jgi:hypothetical protein
LAKGQAPVSQRNLAIQGNFPYSWRKTFTYIEVPHG